MTKLDDIKAGVRVLLEDSTAKRFSDAILEAALRQALDEIDQHLPLILRTDFTVTTAGRDQELTTITGCQYLVEITLPGEAEGSARLEPGEVFTYRLASGVPSLHFSGSLVPAAGDFFNVCYAAGYSIGGFLGQTATSLPAELEHALVLGTAAMACYLRAGSVIERYGGGPQDSARLAEIGAMWRENFLRALHGFKTLQQFGFPPGFALDRWDGRVSL